MLHTEECLAEDNFWKWQVSVIKADSQKLVNLFAHNRNLVWFFFPSKNGRTIYIYIYIFMLLYQILGCNLFVLISIHYGPVYLTYDVFKGLNDESNFGMRFTEIFWCCFDDDTFVMDKIWIIAIVTFSAPRDQCLLRSKRIVAQTENMRATI